METTETYLEVIKNLCHLNGIGFNRCDWLMWLNKNGFNFERVEKRIRNKKVTRAWAYKQLFAE